MEEAFVKQNDFIQNQLMSWLPKFAENVSNLMNLAST